MAFGKELYGFIMNYHQKNMVNTSSLQAGRSSVVML